MGKEQGTSRGETKAYHVCRCSKEDRCCSTGEVGEVKRGKESSVEGRTGPMETHNVPLREIKIDRLAHELAISEETQPYLDCLKKAYSNNAAGHEAALQVVRDLPLEKRYTWRVFSALKWAFADFEDEYVALDFPHISEPMRSEMTKELELRLQQLRMLLQGFRTE
jgi:hypothetical protein